MGCSLQSIISQVPDRRRSIQFINDKDFREMGWGQVPIRSQN